MKIRKTKIPGCYEIHPVVFKDERGSFVKTLNNEIFRNNGIETTFAEEYYTVSRKGVLRGLHFQNPPMAHKKIVYCPIGEVIDAVLDLRKGSPTYGQYLIFNLSAEEANIIYIPEGLAHGFYAKTETVLMIYKTTTLYTPELDSGILWNSAGIPWPALDPIISKRDASFIPFIEYNSKFIYEDIYR